MNDEDVLGAFLLVNNPIVLSEEEIKDVQKAIKKLQQENKELKLQLKGTTHCFDKEEHEKLKKQVEEYKKKLMIATKMEIKQIDETTFLGIDYFQDKCINYETQQKEFINYLEDMLDDENDIFSVVRVKDVLRKYKETIGVSDEKK